MTHSWPCSSDEDISKIQTWDIATSTAIRKYSVKCRIFGNELLQYFAKSGNFKGKRVCDPS